MKSEYDFSKSKPNPYAKKLKKQITIRLDEETINYFKSYLVSITTNPAIRLMSNTDLLNIRDEILGNLNQFLYLLTFK